MARRARFAFATLLVLALASAAPRVRADDDIVNEYRLTLFPYHRISDQATGFGYLGYVNNPAKDYQTAYLGWGGTYSINSAVQLWGGLIGTYTDNQASADKLELRPFVGAKLFLPNDAKWNIYNFSRYEDRIIEDRDTGDWTQTHRIRSRFGVEFPLASRERAWQPQTWYALVDVEPFYRFDKDTLDPLRLRAGIAYVASTRVRLELIYHAQFTRPADSSGLKYTDNIFRLNIKIGMQKGLVQRVFDGGDAGD
jgi:hypothetical protein